MSRWYRAYEGTVTDAKLAEAALVADVSRSVSIAAWHAILESAACKNNSGSFETTPRRVAVILCEPPAKIETLFAVFVELGMLDEHGVASWSKRQHESDSSTERSRKHRERKRNADATLPQRDATPPETESEKETDKDPPKAPLAGGKARKRAQSVEVPEWLPSEEWEAFRRMRKAMRSVPFTDDAERGIIADLAKLRSDGHDLAKVLMKAVKRGWRGVFGDDDTKAKAGSPTLTKDEQIANLKKAIEFYSRIGRDDDVRECRRKIDAIERAQPPPAVSGIVKQVAAGLMVGWGG